MVRYDKLDDDQKDFVDKEINKRGNIWIKGFAGSGKSVMLIHALRKKLIENPNANVCVVVFTYSLIDMFKTGMVELGMKSVPVLTYFQFKKETKKYDYIFCDEVQDLPEDVLTEMKMRSPNVHVAGDSNQSIYENTVSPNEIGNILNARPFILTRIYRLTRSIMTAVSHFLPNLDIFGARRDMTKKDVSIRLYKALSEEEEVKYIWEQAKDATSEGYSTVVLLPLHEQIEKFVNLLLKINGKSRWTPTKNQFDSIDYNPLNKHFANSGIDAEYIGNGYGSFQNAAKKRNLIIMTYHSSKGMDFENVILPFLSDDLKFPRYEPQTLFMVALTRSKMNLFITYSGFLHDYVKKFESSCQRVNNSSNNTGKKKLGFDEW